MKKIVCLLLSLLFPLCVSVSAETAFAPDKTPVTINGVRAAFFDAEDNYIMPLSIGGRTYVPAEQFAASAGIDLRIDGKAIFIGDVRTALFDEDGMPLAVEEVNGIVFAPLAALCESAGIRFEKNDSGFSLFTAEQTAAAETPAETEPEYLKVSITKDNFYDFFTSDGVIENYTFDNDTDSKADKQGNLRFTTTVYYSFDYVVTATVRRDYSFGDVSFTYSFPDSFPSFRSHYMTAAVPPSGTVTLREHTSDVYQDNSSMGSALFGFAYGPSNGKLSAASGYIMVPVADLKEEFTAAAAFADDREYDKAIAALTKLSGYGYEPAAQKLTEVKNASREAENAAAYRSAETLLARKDFKGAIETFTKLGSYSDSKDRITECRQACYDNAVSLKNDGKYAEAVEWFTYLGDFGDSKDQIAACNDAVCGADYAAAIALMDEGKYEDAMKAFEALGEYSDSKDQIAACGDAILARDYAAAAALMDEGKFEDAIKAFEALGEYSDSKDQIAACGEGILAADYAAAAALMDEGKYAEAKAAFEALGEYSDSAQKAKEAEAEPTYIKALALEQDACPLSAAELYNQIPDHKDAAGKAEACLESLYAEALQAETDGNAAGAYYRFVCLGSYKDSAAHAQALEAAASEHIAWADALDAAEEDLVKGSKGDDVKALQNMLAALGYLNGKADGSFGGKTGQAVADFRAAEGLEAGSAADAETRKKLREHFLGNDAVYYRAWDAFDRRDYEIALQLFERISGYKDADSRIAVCSSELAATAAWETDYAVGNYITFGSYPQTEDGNDNTPIEWLILARDGEKALVISRRGLDAQPYNEVQPFDKQHAEITWENCTLRAWLNDTFLKKAFSAEEQSAILITDVDNSKAQGFEKYDTPGGNDTQDRIFLLSYAESEKYFVNDEARMCAPTYYAIGQGAISIPGYKADGYFAGWWWLRSPGSHQDNAGDVVCDGTYYDRSVVMSKDSVRPALWVDLSSGVWNDR